MNGSQEESSEKPGVRFLPAKGSVIGGIAKDKTARITDAMADLKLGIDGLRSQLPSVCDRNQWAQALGPFARSCSVFLRKIVLGDRDKRATRLLDNHVLGSIGLQFDRLRKIPSDERRVIQVGFGLAGGLIEMTRLVDAATTGHLSFQCRAAGGENFHRVATSGCGRLDGSTLR